MARRYALKTRISRLEKRFELMLAATFVFEGFVFSQDHSVMPVFSMRQLSNTLILRSFALPGVEFLHEQ